MFNPIIFCSLAIIFSPPSILIGMLIRWMILKNREKRGVSLPVKFFSQKSENRIQKSWLIFFWLNAAFSLLNIVYYDSLVRFTIDAKPPFLGFWILILIALKITLFYAMYHYIYKNRGTTWLLFLILFVPSGIVTPCAEAYKTRIMEGMDFFWSVLTICCIFKIPYWISCIQLYRLNSSIKEQKRVLGE
ncbi:MAG: hypothetical protein QRY74_05645 [Chlamydia sp.]